jgi:hypothetical protein
VVDEPSPQADFVDHLLAGERVLWTGRPDPNRLFSANDIFLIPFSLMWGGFALFWEASVVGIGISSGHAAPSFFLVWGIPFVLIGQYFIWGRFIYKRWDRKRTAYAVTNQRLLALKGNSLQSMFLTQLPTINQTVRSDGSGTLDFGGLPFGYAFWANSGMDWFNRRGGLFAFYDIRGASSVYRLVAEARGGQA